MTLKEANKMQEMLLHSLEMQSLLHACQAGKHVTVYNAHGSLRSLAVALAWRQNPRPVLGLVPHADHAEKMCEELAELLPGCRVLHFPSTKLLPWGHRDAPTVAAQLEVIEALLAARSPAETEPSPPPIILTTARALATPLLAAEMVLARRIALQTGDEIPFDTLLEQLVAMGFERQPLVEQPGELSVRGGIVDLFPFSRSLPVRLEFWGNKIESIREFDPATQRSERELQRLAIFPQNLEPEHERRARKQGAQQPATLLQYLPANTLVCLFQAEHIAASLAHGSEEEDTPEGEWHGGIQADEDAAWQELLHRLASFTRLTFAAFRQFESELAIDFQATSPRALHGDLKALRQELENFRVKVEHRTTHPPAIYFVCESSSHADRLADIFAEIGLARLHLTLCTATLHEGFVVPHLGLAVYTDHEFYGRIRRRRRARRFKDGLTFRQLKTLSRGDYVVHVDHGIGIYQGLKRIGTGDQERECLEILYQDQDRLFVPLDKMDRVQKYTSREAVAPKIHKLGSPDWERLKKRTKKRIKDIAKDLVTLYAARSAQKGFAFSLDTLWQKELEASFEYEETPDQTRAIEEVKQDMERDRPMDRLVCGDVGFGKTEVAIRAAFKAVQDGKQVAILVPTTLLAQQHYNTFRERLSHFPVKIEVLSRFRARTEQKEVLERLKSGEVDVIIGTHRLLSRDVAFRDLGLVVIDEEQRFGVRHKERLKGLKVNVDVLALSATPIPRTLHMSLMGVRDMTNINTPPKDRLPIHTEVVPFDRDLIRQAILREVHRGGQVFFVNNRISSIYRVAGLLQRLVPEVEIGVAHGQMREHELERVMLDFINRKFNVLVATMIIESGLDMPNVNTMIINRADRFGLAQLYQLRGRVGRSHHKAHCYLLIPPIRSLAVEAIKRLETIEEFTDLGSGLQIALRDLEIRGAGNLLGAEQSGMIDAVGFDLYMRILEEAVLEARQEALPEAEKLPLAHEECRVELEGNAFLPEEYVERSEERVAIYRRLAEARELQEIEAMAAELADRFGRLPEPAQNLLGLASVRLLGTRLGLRSLRVLSTESLGVFAEDARPPAGEPFKQWVGSILRRAPYALEFFQNGGLGFRLRVPKGQPALPTTVRLLASLSETSVYKL